jgi:GT2 family glycosyltransferase
MSEPVKLSIAIVNWNAGKYLSDCLESITVHPPACTYEIWLADNASTDGSSAKVEDAFPQVRTILNQENRGFAGGNNQIIAESNGEYILLLNPDTLIIAGALQSLVDFLDANPTAGGCGPRLSNPDGSLQVSCFPFPTILRETWRLLHLDAIFPLGVYPLSSWQQDRPRSVDAIQGACLLIRRSALNQVGKLDAGYFMYTEEIDLCHRLRQADWPLFWIPSAEVIHYGGMSTRHVADSMFLRLYHSKVRFFRQRYGNFQAAVYKLILYSTSILRMLITPLAYLEPPAQKAEHLRRANQYRSLLRALQGF